MYLYDNAIVETIEHWTNNKVKIMPPEVAFRQYADENNDDFKLPCVSLTRLPYTLKQTTKSPKTFDGFKVYTSETTTIKLNCIPIVLHYQLDLYAETMVQCDNMVREFVFKIINVPKITLDIPYSRDIHLTHNFNLSLGDEVADNSDVVEHPNKGQYFRQTLDLYVNDAYLWSVSAKENATINCCNADIYLVDTETNIIEKE
jgi:hypothetical protein